MPKFRLRASKGKKTLATKTIEAKNIFDLTDKSSAKAFNRKWKKTGAFVGIKTR